MTTCRAVEEGPSVLISMSPSSCLGVSSHCEAASDWAPYGFLVSCGMERIVVNSRHACSCD
ncbi:MAG: hypothetical protein OXG81_11790 [Acidobacteria bacterium]|nr:hypothetical protein [Acidobacteriota bacterium]